VTFVKPYRNKDRTHHRGKNKFHFGKGKKEKTLTTIRAKFCVF